MTGFRNNWSSGLASGGFHSSASSAVSGIGGLTSFGGGAGVSGGGSVDESLKLLLWKNS